MNILLVNHYIGSPYYGMDFRPYYISREWVKMGHNVTMVGASESHIRMIQPEVKEDLSLETIDGIQYIWIKTPKYDKSSSVMRVRNMMSFVLKLMKYARKVADISQPDWVIASSCYPLDIYPSRKIASITKAKLCFEVHDIWPLTPKLIGGYPSWHPFITVMQMAENYMCKHSDKIVSLLWNAEEHYREHGFKGKFYCVRNGYCKEEWTEKAFSLPLPDEHKQLFERLNSENKIIVGFAGGLAAAGALGTLVEAANLLKKEDRICFVLVGRGPEKEKLEKFVQKNKLSSVFFLPPVNKQLIPALVSRFDIAYIGGHHSILHKYGTCPNKLTDYMLAGKPVVMAMDEPGSLVDKTKCGIRIEAENPELSSDAILKISNMSKEERKMMGDLGRRFVETNLKWEDLAAEFIKDLNDKI